VFDEWEDFGLTLSAQGGLRGEKCPPLFDTSCADKSNEPDLESPNNKCRPAGPGIGTGGEPTGKEPNCHPLGNVLIVQNADPEITIPEDTVNGGTISSTLLERLSTLVTLGFLLVTLGYLTWLRKNRSRSCGRRPMW
jgi:hypothetical protein